MNINLVLILVLWAISTIYVWHMHNKFINEKISLLRFIGLILIIILFGPFIAIACIGIDMIQIILCYDIIEEMEKERKKLKIAVVQFGEIKELNNSRLIKMAQRNKIDWYYFDKTADREFEINDLKEHYDILLEVLDNEKNTQI